MKVLERVFPYLFFVPAISALVYIDGLLYPYLAPKTLIIRGTFLLALAIFVTLFLSHRPFFFDRLRNWISWIPGVLLIWAYVCSVLGIDLYHSFWSIFDRGDGLLTLTSVVAFFYLLLLYADAEFIKKLLRVVVWVASLVALFSVLQWVEWATGMRIPLLPGGSGRVGGTLGNAAFLASFMGLTFFVTLLVAREVRGRWQKAAYGGAILQVLAILASATRGTLLALIAAGFVALLYQAWRPAMRSLGEAGGSAQYRNYARFGVVALIVAGGLFFVFRGELAKVPFEPIARLASISTADATVESRLFIWSTVVGEALKSPITGVGAEHIQVLFNRFYDPAKIVEEWFDRTHNAFLDYLVQYGIPGFLLYLALIGVFMREAWRLLSSHGQEERYSGLLLSLAAIVYAVQNFFVFDTALTLWLFLTLFASMVVWNKPSAARALQLPTMHAFVPIAVGGLIALLVVPVSLIPMRANMLLAEAYVYQVYDARRAVGAVEKGHKLRTYADIEYGYQLYEWYTERQMVQLTGEARILTYRTARDILRANYEKYPYDARTAVYYAHMLDVAPEGEEPSEEQVREVLARAIELSPKRIQPRYLLANIEIKKGDSLPIGNSARKGYYESAIQGLAEYSALVPDFAEPYYIIATLYQTLKEPAKAKEWAEKGLAVYTPDYNTAKRAARYYVTAEDWENARFFLAEIVRSRPTDYPVMYDLAKAEFLSGNVTRAREIVEILKSEAPGLVETDPAFLRALGK